MTIRLSMALGRSGSFPGEGISVDAGALSLAGVADGVKVEVHGTFTNRVLQASQIEVKP